MSLADQAQSQAGLPAHAGDAMQVCLIGGYSCPLIAHNVLPVETHKHRKAKEWIAQKPS